LNELRPEAEAGSLAPSAPQKEYLKKALGSTLSRPGEKAASRRSFPVKAPYPMVSAEDRSALVRAQL
jgi:hypothetical protein